MVSCDGQIREKPETEAEAVVEHTCFRQHQTHGFEKLPGEAVPGVLQVPQRKGSLLWH